MTGICSTHVTAPLAGPGQFLHKAQDTEYLSLTVTTGNKTAGTPPTGPVCNEPSYVRVAIGIRDHYIWLSTTTLDTLPLYKDEEVWVATDATDVCVYGHTSRQV